jgi:hypothetical protein
MTEMRSTPEDPSTAPTPERRGASKAEHEVRHASEALVAPHEKRTIGAETSREEDA